MKKSLSYKLFNTIFLAFLVVITGIVISLNVYFNYYFEDIKIKKTINSINVFTNDFIKEQWNREKLYKQVKLFSSTNNVVMSFSSVELSENSSDSGEKESQEGSHNESKVNVVLITAIDSKSKYNDFFIASEKFESIKLLENDTIDLIGYQQENGVIIPISINGVSINVNDNNINKTFQKEVKIIDIKENLAIPNHLKTDDSEYEKLYSKVIDGVQYTISEMSNSKIRRIVFMKSILDMSEVKTTFSVSYSLQPIKETLSVIKSFYPYFFIFALIISLIISVVYSISVTKPISKITSTADDMAKMNFKKKLDISREDELGRLSNSLNTLSTNLENALSDLRIANEKLKDDYDKEVKQEQARKEFIANASHELKTPLGIIEGYAEGIRDCINEVEKDDYLEVITDEIKKMDKLILEMLKISKYDSMDIKINKEQVDILDLIYDEVQAFEKALAEKKLLIDIKGSYGLSFIDYKQISCAFKNLFLNAVKYSNMNSTITIKGKELKDVIRIEVANDCEHFTDEELEKIWKRFYKIDKQQGSHKPGTGLGLSIVKSIFDAHKINYGVYNSKTGVVFWFEVEKIV